MISIGFVVLRESPLARISTALIAWFWKIGSRFDSTVRNRRPPLDPMNALLSFLYAILTNDCVAAAEGVGLDPQVGFLHVLRPGRPRLALDLMEELRAGSRRSTGINLGKSKASHVVEF